MEGKYKREEIQVYTWAYWGLSGKESACHTRNVGSIPDQADPLEKEMSTHSSILAWEIPWTEDSGGLQTMWSQKNQTQLSDQTTCISVIANSFCYEIKANTTL